MIEFKSTAPLTYAVTENRETLAEGRLNIRQKEKEIEIEILKATDDTHDFLFRAMLNVCTGKAGFTVYSTLDPVYLEQFGFCRDEGMRCAVKACDIRFPRCGQK